MSFGKVLQIQGAAILKALSPSVFFDLALSSSSNISPTDLRLHLAVLYNF